MLALYCQIKSRERKDRNNKTTEIIKYYTELEGIPEINNKNDLPKCRVCLQSASVYIYKENNREDIVEALEIFGNIKLNSEDQCPKHLCLICWKFIQEAILFRKTAIISNQIINRAVKADESVSNSHKSDEYTPINLNSYENDKVFIQEDNKDITEDFQNWNLLSDSYINDDFGSDNYDILENIQRTHRPIRMRKKARRMIKCTICDKIMASSYFYNKHVSLHDPTATKSYMCEKCGKEFKNRRAIIDHQITHSGIFPFKCDYCPYRGRTKDALNTHRRTHIGVKQFLCIHCPKRFLHSSNLKTHMFQHQTPQYCCNECNRAFHKESFLKKHFDVDHLGIKPHVCDICGKAFGYRKKLTDHLKGVHKRPPLPSGRLPAYLV